MRFLFDAVRVMCDLEVPKVESAFACDSYPSRQAFLQEQHGDLDLIIDDCKAFSDIHRSGGVASSVSNVITGKQARLPHSKAFGCGFSCKSVSNQNAVRASFKGAVREGRGSTGETFWHQSSYVEHYRPWLSVLENVPNLAQELALESGQLISDLRHINESFTKIKSSCTSTIMDRTACIHTCCDIRTC